MKVSPSLELFALTVKTTPKEKGVIVVVLDFSKSATTFVMAAGSASVVSTDGYATPSMEKTATARIILKMTVSVTI